MKEATAGDLISGTNKTGNDGERNLKIQAV